MGIKAAEIQTDFTANTRGLEAGMRKAESLVNGFAQRIDSSFGRSSALGGLTQSLSNISNVISAIPAVGQMAGALTRPLMDATQAGLRFNMMWENARIGFEGVAGSAALAEEHLQRLQAFGERTPFEFPGLLQSSRMMNTFGFQIRDHIPLLTQWGNAVASSGELSADAIEGVARAFGQMRSLGRVNSEEMSQLAERGIPAWELLAKAIGKSVAETRKMAEQGRLRGGPAVEAITAMIAQDPRFTGQMERMSKTLAGGLSTMRDQYDRAAGYATEGLAQSFRDSAQQIANSPGIPATMGESFKVVLTPVAAMVRASSSAMLGGSLTGGFKEGIEATMGVVTDTVKSMGLQSIWAFKDVLGSHSPSEVFKGIGRDTAEGYAIGLQQGFKQFVAPELAAMFQGTQDADGMNPRRRPRFGESRAARMGTMGRGTGGTGEWSSGDPAVDRMIRGNAARTGIPAEMWIGEDVQEMGCFNPDVV